MRSSGFVDRKRSRSEPCTCLDHLATPSISQQLLKYPHLSFRSKLVVRTVPAGFCNSRQLKLCWNQCVCCKACRNYPVSRVSVWMSRVFVFPAPGWLEISKGSFYYGCLSLDSEFHPKTKSLLWTCLCAVNFRFRAVQGKSWPSFCRQLWAFDAARLQGYLLY